MRIDSVKYGGVHKIEAISLKSLARTINKIAHHLTRGT